MMLKHTTLIVSLSLMFVLGFEPAQSVHSNLMTEAEMAQLEQLDAEATAHLGEDSGKRGNAFVRVVTAPFKAIGKLFGRGKDSNKLRRLSEKDVKKFETAKVARLQDGNRKSSIVNRESTIDNQQSPDIETNEALLASLRESVGPTNKEQALKYLDRGRQLLNNSQLNEAITALSGAVSLDPKLKEAHNLLGVAYEQKGLRDMALQSFKMALRGSDDDPQHLNNMGFLLFKNGDYIGAIKYLKRAAKRAPEDQRIWNNLGLAQAQIGRFEDAYKSFVRAVGEFDGHMNVAIKLERWNKHKEAIKHYEQARALRPNSLDVLARLVSLYDRTERASEAQEARTVMLSIQSTATVP